MRNYKFQKYPMQISTSKYKQAGYRSMSFRCLLPINCIHSSLMVGYFKILFYVHRIWSQRRDDVVCEEMTDFLTDFTT